MVEDTSRGLFRILIVACWLITLVVAFSMSKPIFFAWSHDPGLRLGEYSFGIWLLGCILHWQYPEGKWHWARVCFVVGALGLLFLGILGELQALVYLSLSLLFSLPVKSTVLGAFIASGGIVWTPLWSWLVGPYLGSNLGLISLGLAVCITSISLVIRILFYVPKANSPALQ